jgi:hypothetical protein
VIPEYAGGIRAWKTSRGRLRSRTHFLFGFLLFGFLRSFLAGFDSFGVRQRSFNPDGAK